MDYIFLIIGFVALIKGADMLVDGASSIAKKYGISSLVIGLTIVAFGTSAPEFIVSTMSAIGGNSDIAISNVIGSNISNILLILGITAFLYPIKMPKTTIKNEIPFLIVITIIFSLLLLDNEISRIDSIVLLILFSLFIYYTFRISKIEKDNIKIEKDNINIIKEDISLSTMNNKKAFLFIVLGLTGLIIGGKLIVDSAVSIATSFGVPNSFIGVTIIAIGTSLPELAASIMAALKKDTDMAIGGIIGSNIFNTLWIVGGTGIIIPLGGYSGLQFDLIINLIAIILLLLFAFTYKKHFLDKKEGIILFLLYLSYISYLIYSL